MKDLIIDVRQNPGGYLKEAVNILSQLFEEKDLVLVYTEGEHAPRAEYHTTGKPFYSVSNIVVLVDEGSASASEILAGALQDHDRGVVIGTPTYGKGLVQEQYALSNGGALRLTVARYYTPSGRLIQKPYSNGDAVEQNGQEKEDTSTYYTRGGREVNGSGGITPDIIVEQDFDWNDARFMQLYNHVLEYAIHGYQKESDYESPDDLMTRFPPGEEVAGDLLGYFKRRHADAAQIIDSTFLFQNSDHTRTLLMGMLGSTKFGHDSWFEIMNNTDPVVQKAIEVIKTDRRTSLKF
jgi:carboxyl-terminal processing protease